MNDMTILQETRRISTNLASTRKVRRPRRRTSEHHFGRLVALALVLIACATFKADSSADPAPGEPQVDVTCPAFDPNAAFSPGLGSFETIPSGTLSGAFSVSSTGEATYNVPLAAPPGRAGIQPSLSLTYNSAASDGVVGMGFSISGLSAITRCPKTMARDGEISPAKFDPQDYEFGPSVITVPSAYLDDAFCLDGQRLVVVGKVPNLNIVEYKTFPDNFSKIYAYEPELTGSDWLYGPRFFNVWTKSGLRLEYGSSPTGAASTSVELGKDGIRRSWWISRVSDRHDNTMDFTYQRDQGNDGHTVEIAPLQIDYTGHGVYGDVAPTRRVLFAYDWKESQDDRSFYSGGVDVRNGRRLRKIKMLLEPGDVEVREYRFDYDLNPATQRTLLQQVRECTNVGTCKPPTLFTWHRDGAVGFSQIPTGVTSYKAKYSVMPMDVTGDGLDDLVITEPESPEVEGEPPPANPVTQWSVRRNLGPMGGSSPFELTPASVSVEPLMPPAPSPEAGAPIDYNQDGLMDLLLHDVSHQYSNWTVLLAEPTNGFTIFDTGVPRTLTLGPSAVINPNASGHLADVNGDGVPDLIQCVVYGAGPEWSVNLWAPNTSNGPGFDPVGESIDALLYYPCNTELYTVDVNNDGKVDLVMPNGFGDAQSFQYLDDYLAYTYVRPGNWNLRSLNLSVPHGTNPRTIFLDINGDGLPDVIEAGFSDSHLRAYINTADGFLGDHLVIDSTDVDFVFTADSEFSWVATPIDFNSDGRMDLLIPILRPDFSIPHWYFLQSTGESGDGAFEMVESGIPFEAEILTSSVSLANPHAPRVTDVDGDGLQDVLISLNGSYRIFKNNLGEQDLLATVTDGLNSYNGKPSNAKFVPNIAITYEHMIDRSITDGVFETSDEAAALTYLSRYNVGNKCSYPRRCVVGPRRVVSEYRANNGANRAREFEVAYRDGRYDRLSGGWLGFGEQLVREREAGRGTANIFDNINFDADLKVYPFAGQAIRSKNWSLDADSQLYVIPVELVYERTDFLAVKTSNDITYFTLPVLVTTTRRQEPFLPSMGQSVENFVYYSNFGGDGLGVSSRLIVNWDSYGNILEESTVTESVNLSQSISRTFSNNVSNWNIGQLDAEKECSSTAPFIQCRTVDRSYNAYRQIETESRQSADGDPDTQVKYTYTYDSTFGNLIKTTAEDAYSGVRASCTTYEPDGIFPHAHRNPAGHLSLTKFDAGLGVELQEIDPNGLHTRWGYDGFGRLMKELRPDGVAIRHTITRVANGGASSDEFVVAEEIKTDGGDDSSVEYDSFGRPVRWWSQGTQLGNPAERIMQKVVYDELGERIKARSVPTVESTLPGNMLYDTYDYDSAGRMTKHAQPWKNGVTTYTYEGATVHVYDASGQVMSTVERDALGRPTAITDAARGTTEYNYGPFGALRTVISPSAAITYYERDAYGRITQMFEPDHGETLIAYNGFGDRRSVSNVTWTSSFHYDTLGRPLTRTDDDGTTQSSTTWAWDPPQGIGRLDSVLTPTTGKHYTYDSKARLLTSTLSVGAELFQSTIGYDQYGRVEIIIYPQGSGSTAFAVRNDYDTWGHLVGVSRDGIITPTWPPSSPLYYWKLTATDSGGRIEGELFGNGVATARTYYDGMNRVASILTASAAVPGGLAQILSYEYDTKLNVVSRTDGLQGSNGKETFEYDELDRLTCAYFGSAGCATETIYDADGNIDFRPDVGAYAYDDATHPHAVTQAGNRAYAYDQLGNQISRPGADVITYTPFDLPKSVTLSQGAGTVSYDYSGDRARVRKSAPSASTIYFGDLYERVIPTDPLKPIEHRYYVHSSERTIAIVTDNGQADTTLYAHVDNLGSVDVLTDDQGAPHDRRSYDAWGERRNPIWGAPPPASFSSETLRGFTWHERDDEVGLVNMKGRMYDPVLGRFLSPDPIVSLPTFGQSWNPYSYVLNNPLAHVDPSGFLGEPPGDEDQSRGASAPTVVIHNRDGSRVEIEPVIPEPKPVDDKGEKDKGVKDETKSVDAATDMNPMGVSAPSVPVAKTTGRVIDETVVGVIQGLGHFAYGTGKFIVLNSVTLGGYGCYGLWRGFWDGFKDDGVVGVVNSINPLNQIGRAGVDAYIAHDRGDHNAAGAAAVAGVVVAVVTVDSLAAGFGKAPAATAVESAAEIAAGNPAGPEGFLVRFGKGPETIETLTDQAAAARAKGYGHGVSTKLVDRVSGSDKKHRSARVEDVDEYFGFKQTGNDPAHHTVFLDRPVTQSMVDIFNSVFTPKE